MLGTVAVLDTAGVTRGAGPGAGGGGTPIAAVLDKYREVCLAARSSQNQMRLIGRLQDYYDGSPLTVEEMARDPLQHIGDLLADAGVRGPTARRFLVPLKAALTLAGPGRLGLYACAPPWITLPPNGPARTKWFDADAADVLFERASQDTGPDGRLSWAGLFVCIGLETGARRTAITGLTWDRVDLGARNAFIDFRDPEARITNKRRVATPVTKRLQTVLRRVMAERPATGFVLGTDRFQRKAFDRFKAKWSYGDELTAHVLRHTRVTMLINGGMRPAEAGEHVGANERTIVATYAHAAVDDHMAARAEAATQAPRRGVGTPRLKVVGG